jgi:hypothetical protein
MAHLNAETGVPWCQSRSPPEATSDGI